MLVCSIHLWKWQNLAKKEKRFHYLRSFDPGSQPSKYFVLVVFVVAVVVVVVVVVLFLLLRDRPTNFHETRSDGKHIVLFNSWDGTAYLRQKAVVTHIYERKIISLLGSVIRPLETWLESEWATSEIREENKVEFIARLIPSTINCSKLKPFVETTNILNLKKNSRDKGNINQSLKIQFSFFCFVFVLFVILFVVVFFSDFEFSGKFGA